MKKPLIIGLTGPIGAGKDTVAGVLRRSGALVIDADKIGHEVLSPQSAAWKSLVKVFGVKVLERGGRVNRKKLGGIVFSNPKALKSLTKITHPEIRSRIKGLISKAVARKRKLIVINAAVLSEMKLVPLMDKVIVVLSSRGKRLKRLIAKGRTRGDALARIKSQKSDSSYRRIADVVIINNGSKKDLEKEIAKIAENLLGD